MTATSGGRGARRSAGPATGVAGRYGDRRPADTIAVARKAVAAGKD